MNEFTERDRNRLTNLVYLALGPHRGDQDATERVKSELAKEHGVTPAVIQEITDYLEAERECIRAETKPGAKARPNGGNGHDTEAEPETSPEPEDTEMISEEQSRLRQRHRQTEDTTANESERIPDDCIEIEMEIRKLVYANLEDWAARERAYQRFAKAQKLPLKKVRAAGDKVVKEAENRKREEQKAKQDQPYTDEQGISPSEVVEKINAEHAVVQYGNRVLILCETMDPVLNRPSLAMLSHSDFRLKFLNRTIPATKGDKVVPVSWGEYWVTHRNRREYRGIVFIPEDTSPEGYYNIWRGLAVTPKQGNCVLLRRHIREVICNRNNANFDYLWKWCAHAVQHTKELPEVAVVLRSVPGTGKNTFVDALGKIFGRHYLPLNQNGLLCGRFTAHMADAVLVFANEAVWGGNKQGEGRLKAMITDGVETIEAKGKDAVTIPNFKRIIVASNESWAVPRGIGDRRFFCLDVPADRVGDDKYFASLHQEIDNGGIEAFLYELRNTDLKGWHPRLSMPASNTDGEDMKLRSLPTPLQWWLHALIVGKNTLNNSAGWDTTATEEEMHLAYLDYCVTHRKTHVEHLARFKSEIRRAFMYEVTRPGVRGAPRPVIRRIPNLETCRLQFQAKIAKYNFSDTDTVEVGRDAEDVDF